MAGELVSVANALALERAMKEASAVRRQLEEAEAELHRSEAWQRVEVLRERLWLCVTQAMSLLDRTEHGVR